MEARLIETIDVGNTLGEGVLFRDTDSTVWWTDIQESKLFCLDWPSLKLEIFNTPERVCSFSFIENRDDILLIAFETGIAVYNPVSGENLWLSKVFDLGCGVRMNDGRTNPSGQFWVGAMLEKPPLDGVIPNAKLYRVDETGKCSVAKDGVHISNGLCWAPDGKTVYFADSPTCMIQRASYDVKTGYAGTFEDFHKVENGNPDGAITDATGLYLSAIWGGSCVSGIDAIGQKVFDIAMPASQITCLALGGDKGDVMFATSATQDLEKNASGECVESEAGHLFIMETDLKAGIQPRAKIQF